MQTAHAYRLAACIFICHNIHTHLSRVQRGGKGREKLARENVLPTRNGEASDGLVRGGARGLRQRAGARATEQEVWTAPSGWGRACGNCSALSLCLLAGPRRRGNNSPAHSALYPRAAL